MAKIVINRCYGGFSISKEAMRRYAELRGWQYVEKKWDHGDYVTSTIATIVDPNGEEYCRFDFERTDPFLVQVVEEMGGNANGDYAKLRIVELPKGTLYRIHEYDGMESIETADDIDWSVA